MPPSLADGPSPFTSSGASRSPAPSAIPLPTGHAVFSASVDGRKDLFRIDFVTNAVTRLTSDATVEMTPNVRSDGTLVVYRSNPEPENADGDVVVRAIDGGPARYLTRHPSDDNGSPHWSPTGSTIAFVSRRGADRNRIWTIRADGDAPRVRLGADASSVDWSPEGRQLVYSAPGTAGADDLWITPLTGTAPFHLTTDADPEMDPAWSPDGRWVAYRRVTGGRPELWIVHADGTGPRSLMPGALVSAMSWTGAGTLLAVGDGWRVIDPVSGASVALAVPDSAVAADGISWGP